MNRNKIKIISLLCIIAGVCIYLSCSGVQKSVPLETPAQNIKNSSAEVKDKVPEADSRPFGYNPDLRYDPEYIVDTSVTEISGYQVIVEERGNPFVMFFDKDKKHWNIAVYNYERQFWFWTMDHFNTDEIDLEKIYKKIDLSKTELNREKPDILSFRGYLEREKQPYDYSDDKEFIAFMQYMKENNVPDDQIQYYIHAANNPAKRGFSLTKVYGRFFEESEVGIQFLNLVNNYEFFPELPRESISAGGMELLLQMHDFKAVTSFSGAAFTFRKYVTQKKAVPLIIAEIYPLDGDYTGTLKGKELYDDIETRHEQMFRHDFTVKAVKLSVDYKSLVGSPGVPYGSTTHKLDTFFDENLHSKYGEDTLYIYYFTDREEFKAIDDSPSHPRVYGAYLSNWNIYFKTYFHELGHALSLRHHFPSREYAYEPEAHISAPCIMNYKDDLVINDFCPLCSYSLGISVR